MGFASHAKPKKPRAPATSTRHTWSAELRAGVLRPFRGSYTTIVDKDGTVIATGREPRKLLIANIGDKLLLEREPAVAIVRVVGVEPDGVALRVVHVEGDAVPDGAVWCMRVKTKETT